MTTKEKLTEKELVLIEQRITTIICDIGIPANLKGYRYTREAVLLCIEDNNRLDCLTGIVYPLVAEKFNTTPHRVERAIRHAIETLWYKGNVKHIDEIFKNTASYNKGRPSNGAFISLLADKIILERKLENINKI